MDTRGNSTGYALLLGTVALAGLGGLATLGGSMRAAVAGDATGVLSATADLGAGSPHGAAPAAVSAEAGVMNALRRIFSSEARAADDAARARAAVRTSAGASGELLITLADGRRGYLVERADVAGALPQTVSHADYHARGLTPDALPRGVTFVGGPITGNPFASDLPIRPEVLAGRLRASRDASRAIEGGEMHYAWALDLLARADETRDPELLRVLASRNLKLETRTPRYLDRDGARAFATYGRGASEGEDVIEMHLPRRAHHGRHEDDYYTYPDRGARSWQAAERVSADEAPSAEAIAAAIDRVNASDRPIGAYRDGEPVVRLGLRRRPDHREDYVIRTALAAGVPLDELRFRAVSDDPVLGSGPVVVHMLERAESERHARSY